MINSEVIISEEVAKEVSDRFEFETNFISPYRLASILSSLVGYKINPQMMYNYKKNNMLVCSYSSTQKLQVAKDDAIQFCAKFVERNRK